MKKGLGILLAMIMISSALYGCGKQPVSNDTSKNDRTEQTTKKDEVETNDSSEEDVDKNQDETQENKKTALIIYSSNENANGLIETKVEIEELSESIIVDELIKANVLKAGTAIHKMDKKTVNNYTYLTVDFNEKIAELLYSCGTSGELMVIGSVVNTFLEAYQADFFSFTVEGEIFESGHAIYDEAFERFQFED